MAGTAAQGMIGGRQATGADFTDGDGLQNLGAGIQGAAAVLDDLDQKLEQRKSEDDVTNVRLQVMKSYSEMTKRFHEESLKAPAGDTEFADRFTQGVQDHIGTGRSVATTRKGQQTYDLLTGELTKHFAEKAGDFQIQSAGVKAKLDFTSYVDHASSSLISDPFSYGIVRQLALATINDPDSTYARKGVPKEALIQIAESGLATSYVAGLIQNDHPEFARRELMSGKYDTRIEPRDKLRLVREADDKIKINESKREHFDVKDIANAAVNKGSAAALDSGQETPTGKAGFNTVISGVLKREGGYVAKDGASGSPANFGINQAANPDIDVAKLTPERATQLYKERYWNPINGDSLPPNVAIVAMDAAVNQGVPYAQNLLKKHGGNVVSMIEQRERDYKALGQDPKYAPSLPGWLNRMAEVRREVSGAATQSQGTNKDIRAGVEAALAEGDRMVIEKYGDNPEKYYRMRDAVRHDILNYVNVQANVQASKQAVWHDDVMKAVSGAGGGSAIATQEQLFAIPGMLDKFKALPGTTQAGIISHIDANASRAAGRQSRVNSELEQKLFYRMTLPPTDPMAVTRPEQITAEAANGLHADSDTRLKAKLQELKTPEGKAFVRKLDMETRKAERFMRSGIEGDLLFKINPESFTDAVLAWRLDTEQRIQDVRDKGGDTAKLLDPASPDYVGRPQNIKRFLPNAADITAGAAAGVQANRPATAQPQSRPIKGSIRDGYEFLGGDPAKPESWKKVQ